MADFFLLALPATLTSPWTMVELGIAIGQGKRVLALVEPTVETPADLAELALVRVDFEDREQLRFAIAGFLELFDQIPTAIDKGRSKTYVPPSRRVTEGQDFESRVASAFERGGAEVRLTGGHTDSGVDLVVWMPAAITGLGGRLLVQAKYGALTRAAYERARDQLRGQLLKSSEPGAGLFVYWNSQGKVFKPSAGWPLILTATIAELEEAVETDSLASFLARQRNRIAHSA